MRQKSISGNSSGCRGLTLKKFLLVFIFIIFCAGVNAQLTVTGTVKDGKGNAIPGASVKVKDGTDAVSTDIAGKFIINIPGKKTVLLFTNIGFKSQQLAVNGNETIEVVLEEDIASLKEVVITGYSSQSRATLTTAITKLDNKVLENVPYASLATAMQGTLAGVRVQTTSGQPGAAPRVIVRGGTSINNPNGASPLYIVDGVIRDINDLSSDDIESLQVLKDAASTAIYGARGSNGVVLVTTKSGKARKTVINYKYDLTISESAHTYEFPSAREYLQTARIGILRAAEFVPARMALLTSAGSWGTGNDLTNNTLWTTQYLTPANQHKLNEGWESMPDPIDPTKTLIFKDTDFQPLLYQTGISHNHYISVSGGSDKATFNAGVGYMTVEGIIKTSDYKRMTFNLNGDIKATTNLSFFGRANFQKSADNHIAALTYNALMRATALPNVAKYKFEDGSVAQGFTSTLGNPDYYLPLFNNKKFDELEMNKLTISLGSHWKILPGLSFDPLVSYYSLQKIDNTFLPAFKSGITLNSTRSASAGYSSFNQYQADALFNYKKRFADNHNLAAVTGFTYLGYRTYDLTANGRGAATDNIPTLNASSVPVSVSSAFSKRRIFSYLTSINYDYKQRYLVMINARYDGGSNLGQGNQWGFFPGVSLGWNLHQENFWNGSLSKLVTLKLRASYGENGNISGLGDYTAQGTYSANAIYGGTSAIQNTVLPNPDLKWEESKTLNVGADIGLYRNRVNIIFDVYRRVTDNLITTLTLPHSTGFSSILTNYGSYENKGVELEINANILSPGSAFQWQVSINTAKVKSKILKLPYSGTDKNRVGGERLWNAKTGTYTWQGGLQEGGRVGDMFAYKLLGVYATDAEASKGLYDAIVPQYAKRGGDSYWQDTDGNDTINAMDKILIGNIYPDWTGGFSNYFSYKSFALSVRMDYTAGHVIYNQLGQQFDQNAGGDFQMTQRIVDRGWKKQGDVTDVPQYVWLDPKANTSRGSSAYWTKGDYLALREVTLSYTLPARLLQKLKINSLRINLTGNNLHYFTKYKEGVNAEEGGVDIGRYPLSKNYILGINLSF